MTTHNDKTALHPSANNFALYAINSHTDYSINEPDAEYSANTDSALNTDTTPDNTSQDTIGLRDQLEAHLARYHFHHLSLMALACSEDGSEGCSDSWEFGAYLAGRDLQQESERLLEALSEASFKRKVQ